MTTDLMWTHASLDTFMSNAKNEEDVDRLTRNETRHWITLTETADPKIQALIVKVVGDRYQVVNPDDGDVTFLVQRDIEVRDSGGDLIVPALHKPASQGGHGPRHNSWVTMRYDGETITHTGIHMVTARLSAGAKPDSGRKRQQVRQANAMADQMVAKGKGHRIATGSGDLNGALPDRDDLQAVFDAHDLLTTSAITGDLTPTHGTARIDYTWVYAKDRRLSVRDMRVRTGPQWNSDHDPIDTWVEVA